MQRCKNPHCGLEHEPWIRCEEAKARNAAPQVPMMEGREVAPQGLQKASKPSPGVPAPIKEAKEFLKRVGRPKIYPDRKTQMRELMRRRRTK